jgi:hypothetical protein
MDSQDEQSSGERLRTKPRVSCPQPKRTTFLTYPVALYSRGCCGQVMFPETLAKTLEWVVERTLAGLSMAQIKHQLALP